ncbi:hypothetical protein BANRA_00705 [Escherichia coli]|nr:hypothetical protein BANRA_00705 [Escherichia coli]
MSVVLFNTIHTLNVIIYFLATSTSIKSLNIYILLLILEFEIEPNEYVSIEPLTLSAIYFYIQLNSFCIFWIGFKSLIKFETENDWFNIL